MKSAKRAYSAVIQHRAWWAALPLLSVVLLAPLLITEVPPLLDYPNDLARFVLLAAARDDPVLGPIFMPHWAIIPNLAADGRDCSVPLLWRRDCSAPGLWWPLASGLVAYNSTFHLVS